MNLFIYLLDYGIFSYFLTLIHPLTLKSPLIAHNWHKLFRFDKAQTKNTL